MPTHILSYPTMDDLSRILACTDGSGYSASVYDHSAWASQRMGASVHVIHMLDPQRERAAIADFSGSIGPDARDELLEELVRFEESKARIAQARGRAILEGAREHLRAAGVAEITTEQRHGALVEAVDELAGELIVIGKRGEAADFAKLHLGANLERVIRSSLRPVLVASRAYQPIDRCLIAYDGSPSAAKAVDYAASAPLLRGLDCLLLSVGKPDAALDAQRACAADRLIGAGATVSSRCEPGDPEKVIPEVLKNEGIPLLVMGAYGHSRIRQLILGSTTTAMVRTCRTAVLLFR